MYHPKIQPVKYVVLLASSPSFAISALYAWTMGLLA